ncbi:MAG TPA: hypothetical protein VGO28_07095 [Acidimicrobiia bacterium]
MADWSTISSLATAGGTLVLAAATYSAVRSANRSAAIAEEQRQIGLRPVLVNSRLQDPPEKIGWIDDHWTKVPGGGATAEIVDGNLLLAMSLRNVGAGIAVLQGWIPSGAPLTPASAAERPHCDPGAFRRQGRDMYVPPGDVGFWQGAIRDMNDDEYSEMQRAIEARQRLTVDLLYTDHEGGQRAISRFAMIPRPDSGYMCTTVRHWNLDRQDPR